MPEPLGFDTMSRADATSISECTIAPTSVIRIAHRPIAESHRQAKEGIAPTSEGGIAPTTDRAFAPTTESAIAPKAEDDPREALQPGVHLARTDLLSGLADIRNELLIFARFRRRTDHFSEIGVGGL